MAVMDTLHWSTTTPLDLMVDVTQRPVVFANEDALYKDGPVTGELYRATGLAPAGTTLEGHL
jgi:hypothetical protein